MEFLRKSTWLEKFAFAGAFVVFCSCAVLLFMFNRIFVKPVIRPEDIIAHVSQISNSVQRRTPTTFEFTDLSTGDPVGNGDTIFSGGRSSVTIHFNEGSNLHVGADSLVVIRMLDGRLEIKVEKGQVSGELGEKTKMEVQSDENSVEFTGADQKRFQLDYVRNQGLELSKSALDQTRAASSQRRELQAGKDAPPPPSPPADRPPASSKQLIRLDQRAKFKVITDGKMLPKKNSLKTPYPKEDSVVLHKSSFVLPIFAKTRCEDACQIEILLDGQKYYQRDFGPHQVPLVYVQVEKGAEGRVKWSLREKGTETQGDFEILSYTDENMASALKQRQSVEVVD